MRCTVACRHGLDGLLDELYTVADCGCGVLDVTVEHPVYGQLSGRLELSSRYDVGEFIRRVKEEGAKPLSVLTDGIHLHTLRCPDEDAFQRVRTALDAAGFLVKE